MATVTGPDGVRWKIYRRPPIYGQSVLGWLDQLGFVLVVAQAIVLWPLWFAAKWFGVRWRIAIDRNGGEVGEELVRGWGASQRRIAELAASAAAGTLQHELAESRHARRRSAP